MSARFSTAGTVDGSTAGAIRCGRGSRPRSPPSTPSARCSTPSAPTSATSLSATSKPMSARATSFSDDQVDALALALGAGALEAVAGLGREAHQHLAGAASGADGGQDVGRRHELERPVAGARALRVSRLRGSVVGDGGGHQHDVGVGGAGQRLALQVGGGRRLDDGAAGRADGGVAEQRGHLGAAQQGGVGEGDAHAAAGAVAEEAHRVERLAGAAGGDQHAAAGERAGGAQQLDDGGVDVGGRGQTADAGLALRQLAVLGADDHRATRSQQLDRGLRGGVLPHADVHRRRDHEAAGQRQRRLGQHVVGQPVGQLRERVGGARRDDHHARGAGRVEVRVDRTAGRRCVGQHRCAESPANVVAPTNRSAAGVITTWTSRPSLTNRRHSSAARYAAMPPVTPSRTSGGYLSVPHARRS